MIHFIVALRSEAKPLVEFYKLKKKKTLTNPIIFHNENTSLTVAGIGKINTAMGITHTFYEFNQQKNNIWINIGIAGHKTKKIGNIFLVNKVTDIETKKNNYPFIIDNCGIEQESCITYNKENQNYTNDLSDMEASSFFYSCQKFSTKEFIHSIKIVSDNNEQKINFYDKEIINDLILKKIRKIDTFKEKIYNIWIDYFEKKKKIECMIKKILTNYKLSFTEKVEFKKWLLMYFYENYNKQDNIIDINKNVKTNIRNIRKELDI